MSTSIEPAVQWLTDLIGRLGYLGVFGGMALESACVPLPSEIVLVFAGFAVSQGKLHPVPTVLVAIAGALTGASVSYLIGRYGGKPLVFRYGRYVLLTPARLQPAEDWFKRQGGKAVFICRLISGARALVSLPAGMVGMSYPRFLLYTALGSGLWCLIGVLLGWWMGEEWRHIVAWLSSANHLVLAAGVVVLAAWLLWRWHARLKVEG